MVADHQGGEHQAAGVSGGRAPHRATDSSIGATTHPFAIGWAIETDQAAAGLIEPSTRRVYWKAQPVFRPSLRNMMAAGQKPVNDACSMSP
jgi:hypothetical protein